MVSAQLKEFVKRVDLLDFLTTEYILRGGNVCQKNRILTFNDITGSYVDFFSTFLDIPEHVQVSIEYMPLDHPGHVVKRGESYKITLNSSIRGNFRGEAAVLAHEFAHIFMDYSVGTFKETSLNELFTEVCVVMAGCGIVSEFRMHKDFYATNMVSINRVGYIDENERHYLIAKYLLQQEATDFIDMLSSDGKRFFEYFQKTILERCFLQNAIRRSDGAYACPRCESIILPIKEKIRCDKCGALFKKKGILFKGFVCELC